MSNAEEIRKDYQKKQQPINSLSSTGITSYDNDNDTKSDAEIIKLDYQKKLEQEKINKEIEEANALEAEKDSIALGMKPEEVVATKNWFHKTYDSYNSFFGEYIYRAGIGGAMDAGQQAVEATTEFIELGLEKMSHEFQGKYAANENFKLGDSHIGASMAAEKWNSLSEEEQGKYRDLYKIYDEGDRIYFGNNITLKAPVLFPKIEEPKTMVGGFVRDVSQFMTTFVLSPGGKAKVGKYVIKGGIADALFAPEEGNLATFIKEFGFENEVLDFLDSKVDGSADAEDRLKARMKQTLEGGLLGMAVDTFVIGLKYAKGNEDLKTIIKNGLVEQQVDADKIKQATIAIRTGKAKKAAESALKYRELKTNMIKQFEQTIGARSSLDIDEVINEDLLISSKDKKGFLVLDMDKAKKSGVNIAKARGISETLETEISGERGALNILDTSMKGLVTGERGSETASLIRDAENKLVFPILKPEKLDALVAAAGEIFEKYPDKVDLKRKKVIDNLMDLSLSVGTDGKPILPTDELLDTLNKYGLSYEEYVTMAVGSASEAGKVLQKFSAIAKRFKSSDAKADAEAVSKRSNGFKAFLKLENIGRGLLVSQIATAMRNLQSAGIRAPLEGLQNVMDTALYKIENEGVIAGGKALISPTNWSDSFKGMRYMYDASNWSEYSELSDFILKSEGLGDEFLRMNNQVNEVRRSMQLDLEDSGPVLKIFDKMLTAGEAGVDFLNTPNRWQEYMVRKTTFMGELERLVKREYDIDLMELAKTGNIDDLLSKNSFKDIVTQSVNKAMDITYAKQPDFKVFKDLNNFITRNGLTTIAPFPRFMFNSMELIGNYAAGAPLPIAKKIYGNLLNKGPGYKFTAKDRKMISRNVLGYLVVLPAAMMYRNQEDAPTDYKYMRSDENTLIDTAPMSPLLRQSLWLAEAIKRQEMGELNAWLDKSGGYREGIEVFVGTTFRTGTGEVLFKDVIEIFNAADGLGGEKGAKYFGEGIGEWVSRFGTPLNQVVEIQRGLGYRTKEFKDFNVEPEIKNIPDGGLERTAQFAKTFGKYVMKPSMKRGYLNIFSPGTDEEFIDENGNIVKVPNRDTLFTVDGKNYRRGSLLKVVTGYSVKSDLSEAGKFMEDLGFKDWKMITRSMSPGFKRFEEQFLKEHFMTVVDEVKKGGSEYDGFVEEAKNRPLKNRKSLSDETYIRELQRSYITNRLDDIKKSIDNYIGVIDEGGEIDIDVEMTRLMTAHQKYRRLSKQDRRLALQRRYMVEDAFGVDKLDLTNIEHLEALIDLAKNNSED